MLTLQTLASLPVDWSSSFDSKVAENMESNCRGQIIGLVSLAYPLNERRHRNLFVFSYFQQSIPKLVFERNAGLKAVYCNRTLYDSKFHAAFSWLVPTNAKISQPDVN